MLRGERAEGPTVAANRGPHTPDDDDLFHTLSSFCVC
jgi:hypothetical protein